MSDDSHREGCLVCGAPLDYRAESETWPCNLCGDAVLGTISCPAGHVICDACHGKGAEAAILALARDAGPSPEALAEAMMRNPAVTMHGPEHHVIAAVALVASARSLGRADDGAVLEAAKRARKAPGGMCGTWGMCGAAAGAGIGAAVLAGSTPLKGPQKGLATRLTAEVLAAASGPHARCCKRAVRNALSHAVPYLRETLGIPFEDSPPPICEDVARNRECITGECPWFPGATG